jgi:hypothetical protein
MLQSLISNLELQLQQQRDAMCTLRSDYQMVYDTISLKASMFSGEGGGGSIEGRGQIEDIYVYIYIYIHIDVYLYMYLHVSN